MFYIWRMKMKWYLSTFVIAIAFLGICHYQMAAPNQEILLRFNSKGVTVEQTDSAIASIKGQLQNFGIDSIHIHNENGELRISYHSYIDVESIKKSLSEKELGIGLTSLNQHGKRTKSPHKENKKDYRLDVYEIQKTSDSNTSTGKFLVIVKQDYDRFLNSNFYPSFNQNEVNGHHEIFKVTNKIITSFAILIENTSYVIPEVRAGPMECTNS